MNIDGVSMASFINFGAVGVIAVLGIIFFRLAYRREADQNDANRAEIARLNEIIRNQQREYLPVLTSSNLALEESASVLKATQDVLIKRGDR